MIAGLLVGLSSPELAQLLNPWVGELVTVLLFATGARVGARRALGELGDLRPTLARIAVLQTIAPLLAIGLFSLMGLSHFPLALALSLMLAAPSLTGAPNFAIMMGVDPAANMRLLVLGTALFPLTAFPVFLILNPTGGGVFGALSLSLGLMAAILAAVGFGFAARRAWPSLGTPKGGDALDGGAALLLAIVVVGLMSAIGPLLRADPLVLMLWLTAAFAINFGLVALTHRLSVLAKLQAALPTAIYAGNRNIALFIIVMPDEIAAPLMVFIGCYQVPMYLTPFLLSRLRSRNAD